MRAATNRRAWNWLTRSFSLQLLGFALVLLLAMAVLAALLSLQAAKPSAEQMARSLVVVAAASEEALALVPRQQPSLSTELQAAGVFAVLPPGSRAAQTWLPFPRALRQALQQRLTRPVQLLRLPDGEMVLWLPSDEAGKLPFGIRFEPARSPVARSGLWVVAAVTTVLLLGTWWLARWLSRPLRRLSRALPALAAGGQAPALGRYAPAEIQALADALSEAMRRLRDQTLAREQTLAEISHDLRTPLMRMALAAQMLPDGPHVARIRSDVEQMDQLIGAALELARAGRDEPAERVALAPLIAGLVDQDSDCWTLQLDQELHLRAPPIALRRTLQNLIENARRHGRPPFAVRAHRQADSLLIVVADTGPGQNAQTSDHPSVARCGGEPEDIGTGLGLAIVERLAASFDAQLELQREGAEFLATLRIPESRLEGRP